MVQFKIPAVSGELAAIHEDDGAVEVGTLGRCGQKGLNELDISVYILNPILTQRLLKAPK